MVPQVSPVFPAGHVFTVHPHWFAVPPPPHVCGAVQVPQLTVPPWPSGIVPQLAFAAMQSAGPPEVPVEQAGGFAGGFGIWQAVWKCSSATHAASQIAPDPKLVQQCLVAEYPQIAATQPETLVPLSQPETREASVHVRSCAQAPGPPVVPAPQMLLVQVWPFVHVPQDSVPPHPSAIDPQVAPSAEHVFGVQPPAQDETGFVVGVGQSL
jgi:hypothetical protein